MRINIIFFPRLFSPVCQKFAQLNTYPEAWYISTIHMLDWCQGDSSTINDVMSSVHIHMDGIDVMNNGVKKKLMKCV